MIAQLANFFTLGPKTLRAISSNHVEFTLSEHYMNRTPVYQETTAPKSIKIILRNTPFKTQMKGSVSVPNISVLTCS